MIRQNIILGEYTYIVDLHKASTDMSNKHYEEFVILKTNYVTNGIMFDKDVFFVKRSIFDRCIMTNGNIDTDKLGEMIAFPITNDSITMSYSANYKAFNKNYKEETFNLEDDSDILKIYDKNGNTSLVLCDKLRIWLPITKSSLKSVIHISNLINDIRFHYISENIGNYESDSKGEMKVANDIYSEYIDIWIPNIENLFSQDTHYVKENYNFTRFKQKISFNKSDTKYMTIYPCIYYEKMTENSVQKRLSIEAFRTYDIGDDYPVYLSINDDETLLDWDIMSFNYVYPEEINDQDDIKILIKDTNENILNSYDIHQSEIIYDNNSLYCSTFLMILPFFVDEQQVLSESYACKTFFNADKNLLDNILANPIIVSLYPFSSINETTKTYEGSDQPENSDVFTLSKDIKMAINFEFNDDIDSGDENYGVYMLNCKFNYHPINGETLQEFYLDKVKLSQYDYLDDSIIDNGDYDDDIFNPNIKKCGYVIEMAKDSLFKDILYEYIINMNIIDENSTIIEDTKFRLNFNIKDVMWNAYPDTLVTRVKYEDKISYTIIGSNPIFITKENFKYIINDETSRLALLDINQDLESQPATHKYNTNLEEMAFNFIDKINCTIISKDSNEANNMTNSKTNQRIIYKPIFYKVKDLQQIKLKNGITQNIGLNLSDLISKVDTFKVVIENIEYPEVARNDAFVIFRINAQELKNVAGQYNLLDQDDQFISDGTWYIY